MENNWDLVFRPIVQKFLLVYMFIISLIVCFFMHWRWNVVLIVIALVILVILLILVFLQPKTSYLKIKESELIIWGLDIPTFKTVEQCIQCNNIESIAILKHPTNSVHIKVKDQDKKFAIDWFSSETLDEIKNVLVWKWLTVSLSKMVNNKRETEEFNKKS